MCGIAGIISRNGERQIGSEMTRMLQSMKHRGPDSTGYALYGPVSEGWVMRVKLADANTPRDYEFDARHRPDRPERHRILPLPWLSTRNVVHRLFRHAQARGRQANRRLRH